MPDLTPHKSSRCLVPPKIICNSSDVQCLSDNVMTTHVRVNAIAGYYQIPDLAELTRANIQDMYNGHPISSKDLSQALKEAFGSTQDKALQKIMASVAAYNIESLLQTPEFTGLEDIGDCAEGIIRHLSLTVCNALNSMVVMDATAKCRGSTCTAEFECRIKLHHRLLPAGDLENVFMLRCNKCGCKHKMEVTK